MDTQKAFQLIDRVLPFEACLYHQILPLSLENHCLHLGMVTLEDVAALDYVRRILSFMNYSLIPQSIASEAHYAALSAYLSYAGKQHPVAAAEPLQPVAATEPPISQHAKETFLVDVPDEIEDMMPSNVSAVSAPPADLHQTVTDRQSLLEAHATNPELARTFILNSESLAPSPLPSPGDALPGLAATVRYLNSPPDFLATLPPSQLLQELLGRILTGGIGRLYFERRAGGGRVLWSQNGVLQSVLNELPLGVFQGVIDELKVLTHLPLATVQQPKQVEIERTYQKNRLLLRLRVMPKAQGEEATLQILRGAALKFYQQQQLADLSRDALTIAQELQKKVCEIRDRTRSGSRGIFDQTNVVPALSQVLQLVEQQLEELSHLHPESNDEK
ncbi:MAG: hypothetical protein HC936_17240 [Leptolyngbyaceae cyanobacterium SU_3_3]|nr:hypothetical protein [Leptolyngbyaceae cyanobacterium SU_3_3]NJR50896.1 hypothetical protein [Leptolyngbyaceae cyanobacterium CSU_1_3]